MKVIYKETVWTVEEEYPALGGLPGQYIIESDIDGSINLVSTEQCTIIPDACADK